MASLNDIRKRISSVKNTQQLTRAMKMVAAAKLRRAQEGIFRTRPYAFKISEIISHLKRHVDPTSHRLFNLRDVVDNVLIIIVTADRGLAGAFNANVIKTAEQTIREEYADIHANGQLFLMCVGRKSHEHFTKRGYQLVGDYRGVFNDLTFASAQDIIKKAIDGYMEDRWDVVKVVYNEFKRWFGDLVDPKETYLGMAKDIYKWIKKK